MTIKGKQRPVITLVTAVLTVAISGAVHTASADSKKNQGSANADSENSQRYMVSHKKGKGARSLKVVVKNNGKRSKKLKYRDIIAADLSEKQLAKILRHPLFVGAKVELDPQRFMLADNSSETIPYGIAMVQADPGAGLAPGASATKVCIIDSGYDMNHGDLPGPDRVTGVSQTGDAWDNPGNSHGTHVAGTIAAIGANGRGVVGVHSGDNLSLHIVKVFNDNGSWTNSSDLIDALDSCVASGSDVVSMSLGGGGSSTNEGTAFAQALANNNVLSIAAASNDGNTSYSYPASYDSVVSVAAVNSAKAHASFSNRNDQVELAAPGVAVESTVVGGGYASYNGTSMATPHVSGAAALLWSNHGECNAAQVRRALAVSAEDLGSAGPDNSFGYGLIQTNMASALIDQYGCNNLPELPAVPPPPPPTALANGESVSNLSASTGGETFYSIALPSGASNLTVQISGGGGDADLYLRSGQLPTLSAYDCRPWLNGNNESCSVASPSSSTYYVMLQAYSSYSGVTLNVSYDEDDSGPPVNQPPVARISADPTAGKAPLLVTFDGTDSTDDVGINNWLWNFAGAGSSSGSEAEFTFVEGVYQVVLTVSDGELDDSDTVTINVAPENRDPIANFDISPASGLDTDTSVSFDASQSSDPDGDSLTYAWDFGGDGSASGRNTSHTFSGAGDYSVALTVSDGDGGSATQQQSVTIADAPEPPAPVIEASVQLNRKGNRATIAWSGADSSRVRIKRNGTQVTRTRNDGSWRDRNYSAGASYVVCNDSQTSCSNPASP